MGNTNLPLRADSVDMSEAPPGSDGYWITFCLDGDTVEDGGTWENLTLAGYAADSVLDEYPDAIVLVTCPERGLGYAREDGQWVGI